MKTTFVPFKSEHLQELLKEDFVAALRPYFTEEVTKLMENAPNIFSLEMDGKVVCCGGAAMYWPGRAEIWMFYSSECKKNFLPVFRATKRWMESLPFQRLEAAIDVDNEFGRRQVELAGFQLEAPVLRKYQPDGKSVSLYARVK
jgi:hypothetical protein